MHHALRPALATALESRGFSSLTPIQQAVLDPAHSGRDLRLFSQTGSGKTVAVGLVLAPELERAAAERESAPRADLRAAAPAAILIAPTRELAAQLARELTWLYQPLGVTVCAVTGGTSFAHELRALRRGPLVIAGTPGRLLDHLERGSIDPSRVIAAVLDEADQMLDLGFRDDLEAILGRLPGERRTHLVAATFSREVRALADRYQRDSVAVEGGSLGNANQDIVHMAHLVRPNERDAAVTNLLLLAPAERAILFVRTREGAAELADRLGQTGFAALALSGDLDQRERTRTLEAFRSGAVTTLVATDVAARGLDIPDVQRVIHVDPPGDVETFIHRSGRTGRAGRKGTSIVLASPAAYEHVSRLFRQARVKAAWQPAPSPDDVLRAADARLRAELAAPADGPEAPANAAEPRPTPAEPPRLRALPVTPLHPAAPAAPPVRPPRPRDAAPKQRAFVPFQVTWGGREGADPRRLLALVCRRGGISSDQVGAIRIGERLSTVEVDGSAVATFARLVKRPDARDPRIHIRPMTPRPRAGARPESSASC